MSTLKKLKPGAKCASPQRQQVSSASFSTKTRVTKLHGTDCAGSVSGTGVQETAIRVDTSEVQVIRRGHLPNWFRESLQKDIARLETAERERGSTYTGY